MNYKFKPGDKVTVKKRFIQIVKHTRCCQEKLPNDAILATSSIGKIFEENKSQSRAMIVVVVQCVTW